MTTFADWLRYSNCLDVDLFLEVLTKMKSYHEYGVDVLKDAIELPSVLFQFLL